jgi:hypothetical protein
MPITKRKRKTKKPSGDRKKRVRKHIIADLSANHVERFALLNGFSVECIGKDYGYDLNVYTFNSKGEFETGNIYVQLKATDRPKHLNNKTELSFSTSKRDLKTWYEEPFPVIFILYDAKNENAYWVYIQQHLRTITNFSLNSIPNNYTIRIPKNNIINASSFQQFRRFKLNTIKQITNVITYQ